MSSFDERIDEIEKLVDVGTGEAARNLVPHANWVKAAELVEGLVESYPYEMRSYLTQARVLMNKRLWQVAEANFERAIALARTDETEYLAEAWLGLSVTQSLLGELPGSLAAANRARALLPDEPAVLLKCADMLREQHQYDEAEALYARALEIRPRWTDALYMRSFLYFRQGRWKEAWEHYLVRWGCDGFYRSAELSAKPPQDPNKPFWTGDPLGDRRLLVWTEQGVGDVLWTSRWVEVLLKRYRNASISLRVHPPLFQHMALQYAERCTVLSTQDTLPEYDVHAPLMNLPALLEEYMPPEVQHRAANPVPRDEYTVGIVWAGAPGYIYDKQRSTAFADWAPVLQVPGVRFVSLQVGPNETDCVGVLEPLAAVRDYADTANVIANLDLVIGVDTGVMHLAAVLGVPTWWLLGSRPDWRVDTGATSLWYKKARLWHRRSRPWAQLLADVATTLTSVRRDHGN